MHDRAAMTLVMEAAFPSHGRMTAEIRGPNLHSTMCEGAMRILRALPILLLLTTAFTGQTNTWKKYENKSGNLSVLFPGDPQDSVNKEDQSMSSHTLVARENGTTYAVIYTSMNAEQTVSTENFKLFRDAVFKELPKCDVGPEQPVSPALDGYIGHKYRLSCAMPNTQLTIVGNLYWGKHYAYAVMYMFPASVAESQASNTFVESFSVVDPAK